MRIWTHPEIVLNLLGQAIRRTKEGRPLAVEIGVAQGKTSALLLREIPDLHLIMIDPWRATPEYVATLGSIGKRLGTPERYEDYYQTARKQTLFAESRRTMCRMRSVEAASLVNDSSLVLAFIDGDHTAQAVAADIAAWWPKVMPGGILCGDDCRRPFHGLKRVVRKWTEKKGLELNVRDYVWWVDKP